MNEKTQNKHKRNIALVVLGAIVLLGAIGGYFYIRYKKTHISTDDAFVEGPVHTVASRIYGTVIKIYVSDNQFVHKGEKLVELDPAIFIERVNEARSALNVERHRLGEIKAGLKAQDKKIAAIEAVVNRTRMAKKELEAALRARNADLRAKESVWKQTKVDIERAERLLKDGAIAQARFDREKVRFDTSLAALEAARALKEQAEVALKSHNSSIKEAEARLTAEKAIYQKMKKGLKTQKKVIEMREAELRIAELNLSYTDIYAPEDGYITKKSVEIGNKVRAGQPLMAVVPLDKVYVVANYKETKVKGIKPGQEVNIKVDAYPDKVFEGRVDSIMAGTGAAFSLFPPENATGNYVKVVQRIPVKILLKDGTDNEHLLRPGMSVIPTVIIR